MAGTPVSLVCFDICLARSVYSIDAVTAYFTAHATFCAMKFARNLTNPIFLFQERFYLYALFITEMRVFVFYFFHSIILLPSVRILNRICIVVAFQPRASQVRASYNLKKKRS